MGIAVGIDLGTSNSAVAALKAGKHQVLSDEHGNRLTPSVISFGKDQKILVGNDAKAQMFSNPRRTIHSIKRLIGRKMFTEEVKKSEVLLPYKLTEGLDQNVAVDIDGQIYSPQEISAFILRHMKDIAHSSLGSDISDAVVTVPAHFNDHQRQATKDACSIAGLNAIRIINEPTAAALAYGFGKGLKETVVIYDLGGGTFDLSVLRLKDKIFEVVATAGDTFLGGDDFDDRIIDLCAEHFLKERNVDLRKIPQALPMLRMHAEKAKRKLSYAEKTDIYIPSIVQVDGAPVDLQFSISRSQFEGATHDLIQRTFGVCDEALRMATLRPQDLDAIILVGGPTKMSLIYDAVHAYFGKPPLRDLNPDEVVAIGASIQAQTLTSSSSSTQALLLDVTPLDLGIETVGGFTETVVDANSPIPTQLTRLFTTTKDDQEMVAIRIIQGKNRRVENSTCLGEFHLSGFRKAKAGEVTIEVVFAINPDGIVEVSACDPETGVAQSVKVKLNAAFDSEKLRTSSVRSKEHQEVRLKTPETAAAGAVKVVLCIPSRGGPTYEEGTIRNFDPLAAEFELFIENSKEAPKRIDRSQVEWLMTVEDFSNIPRYLNAITARPQEFKTAIKNQLYQFKLKDGTEVFGQADLPKIREEGFWIEPYFSQDQLPGRLYVYSANVSEAEPIKVA